MPVAVANGLLDADAVVVSPHLAAFQQFVDPSHPEQSTLHALLQSLFPWRLALSAGRSITVAYQGYRVLPPLSPSRHPNNYHRLSIALLVTHNETSPQATTWRMSVPKMTEAGSFVVDRQELVPIAQLLPAPGPLVTTNTDDHKSAVYESMAEIRLRYGLSLRFRCRRGNISVQVGAVNTWPFWYFLKQCAGPDLDAIVTALERLRLALPDSGSNDFSDEGETRWDTLRSLLFPREGHIGVELGARGRAHMTAKFQPAYEALQLTPPEALTLQPEDLLAVGRYLAAFHDHKFAVDEDDGDHLGHQHVRLVSDIITEAVWRGLKEAQDALLAADAPESQVPIEHRIERAVQTRLQACLKPGALMRRLDTTNPLAALSQKRLVTRGGPGGVAYDRPHLAKRDVHPSHYGRLCPCETPESEAIGLALHLARDARVVDGQIEAPHRDQETGEWVWERADRVTLGARCTGVEHDPERQRQGRVMVYRQPTHTAKNVPYTAYVPASDMACTDITPEQQLGIAASLIPFLSHSDATLILMGAKNMKQALPLMHPEPPWVQTGMEAVVASRQLGQSVKQPQEAAVADGKLALGRNLLVAYMPWRGYNFADAIVVSERLVCEDILTSIHEFDVTFDLPTDERILPELGGPPHLNPYGVVQEGTAVREGMVLLRTGRLGRFG